MNTGTRQHHRAPGTGRGPVTVVAVIDPAEIELADSYELPGAELAPEEQALEIIAEQADEFTCSGCFLVRHRSQMAKEKQGLKYCRDCEG